MRYLELDCHQSEYVTRQTGAIEICQRVRSTTFRSVHKRLAAAFLHDVVILLCKWAGCHRLDKNSIPWACIFSVLPLILP